VRSIRGQISPLMVLALTALWLMLNQSMAPGDILLGAVLAIALSWSASRLRPLRANFQRLDRAALLALVVLVDIVRSSLSVAGIVLGWVSRRDLRSDFLQIPLDLRDPHGLAALAIIVTSTPGTVWVGLSPAGDTLTLHVLDLRDETELIQLIKDRYERPLMRIFE
jgi:multicomponent K+:H+ antiporter subunit E